MDIDGTYTFFRKWTSWTPTDQKTYFNGDISCSASYGTTYYGGTKAGLWFANVSDNDYYMEVKTCVEYYPNQAINDAIGNDVNRAFMQLEKNVNCFYGYTESDGGRIYFEIHKGRAPSN